MSKLSIDQKNVKELLGDNKTSFLIPSYQRQYGWEERECSRLWEDLLSFTFPDNDSSNFDKDRDEYFLGPIVTFPNAKKQEVIDGHQRLITLTLLLRAFYTFYNKEKGKWPVTACRGIKQCIWKTDEAEELDMDSCRLETHVATDEAKREFRDILRTGEVSDSQKSHYAENYRFFQKKIKELSYSGVKGDFALIPIRIMNNCILLPIEADTQDTALQIFSTLNDRGKPLSDSDIFKAQLYEYYDKQEPSRKDEFTAKWKMVEEICAEIFPASKDTPVDEIFTRYMYYERANQGIKSSTTEAVRKFYEKQFYSLLKRDETFENIIDLANFWKSVFEQDEERFSERVLKRLFVLNYAPNDMWTDIVSVYYLANRDLNGMLDDEKFYNFLKKITAFTLGYSLLGKGSSDFRAPIYTEMVNIVQYKKVGFEKYTFTEKRLYNAFYNYEFTNRKLLTKSMLAWWIFDNEEQMLLPLNKTLELECILQKIRLELHGAQGLRLFDSLGNKFLCLRCKVSNIRFTDKIKSWYQGDKKREEAKIIDLYNIPFAKCNEENIVRRNNYMFQKFIEYLNKNGLIK